MEKSLKVHDAEGRNEWDVLTEARGLYGTHIWKD